MKFNQSFYNTLDRGYYTPPEGAAPAMRAAAESAPAEKPLTNLDPTQIGFGSNPFQHPIQGVQARIKQGVGYVDIPFFGAGKGNKERYTPESISYKERRDIKELAEVNKIKLSTHASTNIMGLSGFGREGFNEQQREETLKEIKKAIDFASDIQGGAVVFHTGEFPRPFSEQKWNENRMFMNYPEEEAQAVLHMVDQRTGEVIGSVRKSVIVYEPEYEKITKDGKDYWADLDGNPILDETDTEAMLKRMPKWDEDKEWFKTERRDYDHFKDKAQKLNEEHGPTFTTPEQEYMKTKMQERLLRSRGQSLYYTQHYEHYLKQRDEAKRELNSMEKIAETIPEEERETMMMDVPTRGGGTKKVLFSEYMKDLNTQLASAERSVKHVHEASASADVEAMNVREQLDNMQPIADYGIKKSADTVARAAEFAWQKTRQMKGQNKDFRDIYVSPESWLPSHYGSHPEEMENLIDQSRAKMAVILREQHGMSEKDAKKAAANHIKGTLDMGHFNMWRQHFKAEQGEAPDETDKRFKKWYLKNVQGLLKSGKIGQVHITDNMGFDDEHLTPGEGTVPMKEVMKMVEKSGIKDLIVEAGSFNPVDVVPDTWEFMGSPVYSVAGRPSFNQFHNQHFGYDAPPFYVVGAYAPSNEWTLWSDVRLE